MVSVGDAANAANAVCTGLSCAANEGQGVINYTAIQLQVYNVGFRVLNTLIETVATPNFGAGLSGLVFANGLNNLARPGAGGMYVLANFAFSGLMGSITYNQVENIAVPSLVFTISALGMAFQRIKTLENALAARSLIAMVAQ